MSALIALATSVGAPLVRGILERRIGTSNAVLVEEVSQAIASRVGVDLDGLDAFVDADPERVKGAISYVEQSRVPAMLSIMEAGSRERPRAV